MVANKYPPTMFFGLTKGLSGSAKTKTNVAPKGATSNAIFAVSDKT